MEVEVVRLRLRRSGSGSHIYEATLPKEFVEKLGWKPGVRLLVELDAESRRICFGRPEM